MELNPTSSRKKSLYSARLMQIGTSDLSIGLMRGQLKFFREAGFEVSVVSSPGPNLQAAAEHEAVQVYAVPMERELSGMSDLGSLWTLWRLMRRVRPTITNVSTPKAGLLAGIAAWLNQVPCRVYTLRGLRCETFGGWRRRCLIYAERLSSGCAHRVICVSRSLREKAIELRIAAPEKLVVLESGSSNGVDVDRFTPTPERLRYAAELRNRLAIPPGIPVIGFVGRFVRDKGICELIASYSQLRHRWPTLHLLLVGDFEAGDPVPDSTRRIIAADSQIVCTGMVLDPEPYYRLMDVVVLPTYREGFPNTVLEAQAAGKPVVTTLATGARDSVQDGITGILVPVHDPGSLAAAVLRLIEHPDEAMQMGRKGRERVRRDFSQKIVWKAMEREFISLLQEKGLPVPQSLAYMQPLHSPVNPN